MKMNLKKERMKIFGKLVISFCHLQKLMRRRTTCLILISALLDLNFDFKSKYITNTSKEPTLKWNIFDIITYYISV